MQKTNIPWADYTWNPVTGCSPVSRGCENCYARVMAKRLKAMGVPAYADGFKPTFHPEKLDEPLKLKKPSRIFVASMGDLFHPAIGDRAIGAVWGIAHKCTQHTFVVLTKRAERMANWTREATGRIPRRWWMEEALAGYGHPDICLVPEPAEWPLPNLWTIVSVEDQAAAEERIPHLMETRAAVRGVSVEPMLGPVDLRFIRTGPDQPMEGHPEVTWHPCGNALRKPRPPAKGTTVLVPAKWQGIDWVICGCESGPGWRPCKIDWIRDLRDQCVKANVPFFLKQMEVGGKVVDMPELDGRVWDQVPETESER